MRKSAKNFGNVCTKNRTKFSITISLFGGLKVREMHVGNRRSYFAASLACSSIGFTYRVTNTLSDMFEANRHDLKINPNSAICIAKHLTAFFVKHKCTSVTAKMRCPKLLLHCENRDF